RRDSVESHVNDCVISMGSEPHTTESHSAARARISLHKWSRVSLVIEWTCEWSGVRAGIGTSAFFDEATQCSWIHKSYRDTVREGHDHTVADSFRSLRVQINLDRGGFRELIDHNDTRT